MTPGVGLYPNMTPGPSTRRKMTPGRYVVPNMTLGRYVVRNMTPAFCVKQSIQVHSSTLTESDIHMRVTLDTH